MKKIRSAIIALLVCLAAMFAFAACGGEEAAVTIVHKKTAKGEEECFELVYGFFAKTFEANNIVITLGRGGEVGFSENIDGDKSVIDMGDSSIYTFVKGGEYFVTFNDGVDYYLSDKQRYERYRFFCLSRIVRAGAFDEGATFKCVKTEDKASNTAELSLDVISEDETVNIFATANNGLVERLVATSTQKQTGESEVATIDFTYGGASVTVPDISEFIDASIDREPYFGVVGEFGGKARWDDDIPMFYDEEEGVYKTDYINLKEGDGFYVRYFGIDFDVVLNDESCFIDKESEVGLFRIVLDYDAEDIRLESEADEGLTAISYKYLPSFAELTEETCYYSDELFNVSACADNVHLMQMSYALAISTSEVRGYSYAADLLGSIGFTDLAAEDILEETSRETIGTIIAHKKMGDNNVIALLIRSDKYDREWASNVIVGNEGDIKGFSDARYKALERLQNYISEYGLTNNKIWVVGYSRGGAVADLIGVTLNKDFADYSTSYDGLYIYAFEPPAACADDTVYDNINIVVDLNDPIVYVCPPSWDIHVNGKITYIGEEKAMTSYTAILSPVEYEETTQKAFLTEFFDWLSSRLTREVFADELEAPLADILEIYFSKTADEKSAIIETVSEVGDALKNDFEKRIRLTAIILNAVVHHSDYLYDSLSDLIIETLDEKREDINCLSDTEYEAIKTALYPVMRRVVPLIVDDTYYHVGVDYDDYYGKYMPEYYLGDREYGYNRGYTNGEVYGYDDGFGKREFNDEPRDNEELGEEYVAGYEDGYKEAYAINFALGAIHADDLAARGTYDGKNDGADRGFYAGQYGDEFNPENEFFSRSDWMSDEYVEAYAIAFAAAYAEAYDEGKLTEPEEDIIIDVLEGYNIATLIKNGAEILLNHYSQNVLAKINAIKSFYD